MAPSKEQIRIVLAEIDALDADIQSVPDQSAPVVREMEAKRAALVASIKCPVGGCPLYAGHISRHQSVR